MKRAERQGEMLYGRDGTSIYDLDLVHVLLVLYSRVYRYRLSLWTVPTGMRMATVSAIGLRDCSFSSPASSGNFAAFAASCCQTDLNTDETLLKLYALLYGHRQTQSPSQLTLSHTLRVFLPATRTVPPLRAGYLSVAGLMGMVCAVDCRPHSRRRQRWLAIAVQTRGRQSGRRCHLQLGKRRRTRS